ncbi:MAG: hypothetical protein CVV64_05515 [Candidatus Wallbacteria bacterium HGW-Wallbacteria-1]|jgi:hypothetical protein|uniref:DUF2232 domain-containing protein n=1 Tax=Candidatus Wallbacteria bacterium HGW-Wallbacteria-1 TaxID=2013854 RepID=A0A2N1PSA8_9BACT|nr:MAG: hypothetical protein CVV64_05515 [Candidatus Wallbacteria bacterium HGW-Wallbacteria-1]
MGKTGRKIKRAQKPAPDEEILTKSFTNHENVSIPDFSVRKGIVAPQINPVKINASTTSPETTNTTAGTEIVSRENRTASGPQGFTHNENNSSRGLILSGLLATLSFLIFCLTLVPVIQIAAVLFTPVPITYLSMCFGLKFGLLASMVGAAMTAMFMGPIQAYFYFSLFAIVGVVTGVLCRKGLSPMKLMVAGTAILVIGNILSYYGIERALGLEDFIKEARRGTVEAMQWGNEKMMEWGKYSDQQKQIMNRQSREIIRLIDLWLKLPIFIFVIASFSTFFLNHTVSSMLFSRMKIGGLPPLPPFLLWKAPSVLAMMLLVTLAAEPFTYPAATLMTRTQALALNHGLMAPGQSSGLALIMGIFGEKLLQPEPSTAHLLLLNLKLILSATLYFFGLSVAIFMLWSWKMPALFRLATLLLSIPFFFVFMLIGAIDSIMDFRGLEKLSDQSILISR